MNPVKMQILIQYMKNTNIPLEQKIRFYESLKDPGIGVPKVSVYFEPVKIKSQARILIVRSCQRAWKKLENSHLLERSSG